MSHSQETPTRPRVTVIESNLERLQLVGMTSTSTFLMGSPERAGAGPAPYDLLCAALGACTAMTMRVYAERHRIPLTKVEVHVTHAGVSGEDVDIFDRRIRVHGALEESHRTRLLEIARNCPVAKTLGQGCEVRTQPFIDLVPLVDIDNSTPNVEDRLEDLVQDRGGYS